MSSEADHLELSFGNAIDDGDDLVRAVIEDQVWAGSKHSIDDAIASAASQWFRLGGQTPAKIAVTVEDAEDVVGQMTRSDGSLHIVFTDGSDRSLPELNLTRDSGQMLLLPVTADEIAGIEPILAELWSAVDNEDLTEVQRAQIVTMANLIQAEQRAAVPGETTRWKLVGTVRAALKYLAKEAPRDALAWWKLAELLEKIDWSTLASELPL